MAAVPQKVSDAPAVGRMLASLLAARPGADWQQSEIARAMGLSVARVRAALSVLRQQGALEPVGLVLRDDWSPPPAALAAPRPAPCEPKLSAGLMREMLELHQLSLTRMLDHRESERLGTLIQREQRQAHRRPERIAELLEEVALLEALEIADKGAGVIPEDKPEIDLQRGSDGAWSARGMAA